jgi:hypothetical protein
LAYLRTGKRKDESAERGVRAILEQLSTLQKINGKDTKYVQPVWYSDTSRNRTYSIGAYGLSRHGVNHAFQNGFDTRATKTIEGMSPNSPPHEVAITEFHVELKLLAEKHNLKLVWHQSDLRRTINPDAMFTLTSPSGVHVFFLEMERSKPGNYRDGKPQITRKLEKYYDYYDSDKCEKEWGFRKFRIIVSMRNEERRDNLLKVIPKHRMFWLGTESNNFQFQTPKDSHPTTFLDL